MHLKPALVHKLLPQATALLPSAVTGLWLDRVGFELCSTPGRDQPQSPKDGLTLLFSQAMVFFALCFLGGEQAGDGQFPQPAVLEHWLKPGAYILLRMVQ